MKWCLETGKCYKIYNTVTGAEYLLKCINFEEVFVYRQSLSGKKTHFKGKRTFTIFKDDVIYLLDNGYVITEIQEEGIWLYDI